MGPIGIPELIIVLVILLVIFGPKRLPGLGRSLGSGMREFKESVTGERKDDDHDRPALQAAPSDTAPAPSTVTEQHAAEGERVSEPRA
jgi:sec-independent protein translocase protein TatA